MYEFKMPSLGADMDQAKLVEWKIKPGARVRKGDIIAVIETSKSTVEVETFKNGVVKALLLEPGDQSIPVGTPLALLEEETEHAS